LLPFFKANFVLFRCDLRNTPFSSFEMAYFEFVHRFGLTIIYFGGKWPTSATEELNKEKTTSGDA